MDDGVTKYRYNWIKTDPLDADELAPLIEARQRCYDAGYIGLYPDGVGYGNISMRSEEGFIISGTQTGGITELGSEGFCEVVETNIEQNSLICRGPVAASSEALTHAALYRLDHEIGGVIHIHNREMWERLMNTVPTTLTEVPYGTPEMAWEIERLWRESNLPEEKIVVMAGHPEGIIWFGKDLEEIVDARLKKIMDC
ncbi:MAG: class II aldolase/adducin family protein [Ignavibacteriae bacterium]|nr:class II aldolase/adducin family protein [Ignavibacteriota bacterium]MCB9217625.1 class II aldolase/adducin family protein [Ignavibacteria bacterium]